MILTYETISKMLIEMATENYSDMVRAFLAMELSIDNKSLLNQLYQDFMAVDDLTLVSDELRDRAESYQLQMKKDITDILEKLYQMVKGTRFIMDTIASNSISTAMEGYDFLEVEDYASLSLETLQEIIQKDLAISSQDYFGDVTYIALQKDLLDQKSHFLKNYVASFLDKPIPTKDQRALVLY
ncbi:TPA: hypothetical protein ACG5JW_001100 [Streptococcus agalactiae]